MRSMLALVALALAPTVSAQATWYVDINGTPPGSGTVTDPYTSINYAVSQASTISGDLVLVSPGTYSEQVVIPAKGVHVKSTDGPTATQIDAGGGGSAVSFLGTDGTASTLEGFTLTKGTGTGSPTPLGGGIYGEGATVSVLNCVVDQNTARYGGGVYLDNCATELKRSVVRNNTTSFSGHGGGIHLSSGTTSILECRIEENAAGPFNFPGLGGGLYANGPFIAKRTVFRSNKGYTGGGGIFAPSGQVEQCLIESNSAQYGGGIMGGSGLIVYDSVLRSNVAETPDGSGQAGGGSYGPSTFVRCTIVNNEARGNAGGVYGGTLVDCLVIGNWATPDAVSGQSFLTGGAFFCTLTNCVIARNWSIGNGAEFIAFGGGAAQSTLVGCTVYQNSAQGSKASGGGLANCDARFTTVYDNQSDGYGGGIHAGTTINCTVVGNEAKLGAGGILAFGQSTTVVQNSIIWNNGQEILPSPNGSWSVTYCDVKGGFPGTGNINLDPQFWNEAARDFHLLATSTCIDAGDPLSPPDPDGSQADMGAFPYDPSYTGG